MNLRKIISTVTLFAISCSFAFNVSAEESKKISRDELLEIATGYTSYTLDGEYIDFETFTDEHKGIFAGMQREHSEGEQVVLRFITDSKSFEFDYKIEGAKSGFVEIFVDGAKEKDLSLTNMEAEGTVEYLLTGKECRVDVYLPRNGIKIKDFSVEAGSVIKPVTGRKKAVFYGDSITYGYGLDRISEPYANVLSRIMDYEFVNYGIGGYIFNPAQFVGQGVFEPDIVFVAYGANDAGGDISTFDKTVKEFMDNLRKLYPEQKVYVLTPLWTSDKGKTTNIGAVREIITEVCSEYDGVEVIDGLSLIPSEEKFFSDGLHPNKTGNLVMAKNIALKLDKTSYTDVTDMGSYDIESEKFTFNDYPANIFNSKAYAFYKDMMISLDGQQAVRENDRFFVPTKFVDMISGKTEPVIYKGNIPVLNIDIELSWMVEVSIDNLLPEKEISGSFRFTAPESFASINPVKIEKINGNENINLSITSPEIDPSITGYDIEGEFVSSDGEVYKFSKPFRGLVKNYNTNKPITIDGIIDEEWRNSKKIFFGSESAVRVIPDWGGKEDLSCEFSTMWDEEYLYFSAKVTDDVFSQPNAPSEVWKGDSIQLGLHSNVHGLKEDLKGGTEVIFEEIALAISEDKPVAYRFKAQTENTAVGIIEEDEEFDLECVKDTGSVVYEMKISWKKLFGSEMDFRLSVEVYGENIKWEETSNYYNNLVDFSILVNDDDGNGRRGWIEYGSGIGLTKDVNEFVEMQLIKDIKGADGVKILYNGEKLESDVKPFILASRVYVPVRAIFEKLGADVEWDAKSRTVISSCGEESVDMQIDNTVIQVNGKDVEIDVPAIIMNNRTFVPVRVVSECYGCQVDWDEETHTVLIKR